MLPDVSVIIPSYNSSKYLVSALESVFAQTYKNHEVLLVDDGSDDDTASVVARFASSLRYIRINRGGVAAARNVGIAKGRGKYVAFLDADDLWKPTKLEQQLQCLASCPTCRTCYCDYDILTSDGAERYRNGRNESHTSDPEELLTKLVTQGNAIGAGSSTVLTERSLLQTCGGFDIRLSQCADWDMWIRLSLLTGFAFIDERLVTYRQHGTNMSRNVKLLEEDSLLVLKKAFCLPLLPRGLQRKRRRSFARNYTVLAGSYYHAGQLIDFLRCAVKAITLDPPQLKYFVAFPTRRMRRARNR